MDYTKALLSKTPLLIRVLFIAAVLVSLVYAVQASRQPRISITILDDETGTRTPVRVLLVDSRGNSTKLPDAAIGVMHGLNHRFPIARYARLQDSSFYVDGSFEMDTPPGRYHITLKKGIEYRELEDDLIVEEGKELSQSYRLKRWIDMPEKGWYSSDDHIHLRRTPDDNKKILRWIAAEDVHVGNLLCMGDFWSSFFEQFAWGKEGLYQEGNHLLVSSQEEPRTQEIGHTISLGADNYVRYWNEYYHYDKVFDRVHQLNGVTGYAHQGMSFCGYRGMTLDVLRDKIDFLELVQFCVEGGPLHVTHYYHFLDLGFKLTATAGSDFPWGWRGKIFGYHKDEGGRLGNARFYTYLGKELTFEDWMANLRSGHTFATSGPMLEFTVNGKLPGDAIDVSPGTMLNFSAKAYGLKGQIPLRNLEIVGHGKPLKRVTSNDPGQSDESLEIEFSMPVRHGIWIAAVCSAAITQLAHTTPVYITVNGDGFHNPESVDLYLQKSEKYLQEIEKELANPDMSRLDNQIWRYKDGLNERIARAREKLMELKQTLK